MSGETSGSPGVSPPHGHALRELHADLRARGFFEPSHFWWWKLAFWIPVFFAAYFALLALPFGMLWLAMVPVSSVAFLTMGYVGHDAGHYSLAKSRVVNDCWGQFGMTFLCGFSFGYWRARHNQHHAHCQEVGGDPDMRFGVLFSVYPNSDNWHSRGGRFFLRIQKWAFWPLSSLYWVSLRYDGIRDLFQQPDKTKVDRFLLPLHWLVLLVVPGFIFGWPAALLAYVSASCISSLMTASVFIPNHIGMRRLASGEKLSYLEQQVTTSRDISNPRLLDFYYGGLNAQIEHHLFPRVAHNRYRAMRPIVRAFCLARGIPYQEASLYRALAAVGNHLGAMTAAYLVSATETRAARGDVTSAPVVEQVCPAEPTGTGG
jgi:fatty acid desaturase